MAVDQNEFNETTKRKLCDRVGGLCSYCLIQTKGPSAEAPDAVSSIGEAAHVRGAHKDARRFDENMTPSQRSAFENGIWLCRNCHGKVDRDEVTFTVQVLLDQKTQAEKGAQQRQGKQIEPPIVVDWGVAAYATTYKDYVVTVSVRNPSDQPTTIMGATLRVGSQVVADSTRPPSNRVVERWLDPGRERLGPRDGVQGSWFFGWSFEGGGDRLILPDGAKAGVLTLRLAAGSTVDVPVDIVNLAEWRDAQKKHRELIGAVAKVLTKRVVAEVVDALERDHLVFNHQIRPLREVLGIIRDAMPLSAPPQASTGLPPLDDLRLAIARLCEFVGTNFFPFPSAGGVDEHDLATAMWPDGNVDRGFPSEADTEKYEKLQNALEDRTRDLATAYDCFEATATTMQ